MKKTRKLKIKNDELKHECEALRSGVALLELKLLSSKKELAELSVSIAQREKAINTSRELYSDAQNYINDLELDNDELKGACNELRIKTRDAEESARYKAMLERDEILVKMKARYEKESHGKIVIEKDSQIKALTLKMLEYKESVSKLEQNNKNMDRWFFGRMGEYKSGKVLLEETKEKLKKMHVEKSMLQTERDGLIKGIEGIQSKNLLDLFVFWWKVRVKRKELKGKS